MISVPVWLNIQVVSSHLVEKHKTNREQWFAGSFQLAGFKNGVPFYSNLEESHYIHYRRNRNWHMSDSDDFEEDNGSFYFRIFTSGKVIQLEKFSPWIRTSNILI